MYLSAPLYIYEYDKNKLSLFDKLLFISIYGLTKQGSTRATNKYFSNLLSKSEKTIIKSMKRLDNSNLITRETFFNRKIMKNQRTINIVKHPLKDEIIHAPIEIYFHKISDGAKLLLIQLVGLSKQEGYVYATNKELAKKMNISDRMLYRYLKELRVKNLITITQEETIHRIIFISRALKNNILEIPNEINFADEIQTIKEYIQTNFNYN